MARPSVTKSARPRDGGGSVTGEEEEAYTNSKQDFFPPATHSPKHSRTQEPPELERAVASRTRFQIMLPTPPPPSGAGKASSISEANRRGWSSPHGEPYRPLGRPELNLKFSPQFISGVNPIIQNAHQVRAQEGGGSSNSDIGGSAWPGNNPGPEKMKEVREASSCESSTNTGAPIATLVDQFVTSLTSRKRPLDERQVKLAHRLQANVGGFSPERVRGLHRRKSFAQGQEDLELTGKPQHFYQTPRGDKSLQLLRKAIEEGTSRLRSTRNGTHFLQHLPPSDFHGLHELHEHYLVARTKVPQLLVSYGSSSGGATRRTTPRTPLGSKPSYGETSSRHARHFGRDEDAALASIECEDSLSAWYLPYTTRQLQHSPHCRLPSLGEFQVRNREEKQHLRFSRACSSSKEASSLSPRTRVSAARPTHASVVSARSSMTSNGGVLSDDNTLEPSTAAFNKGASSPFAIATASPPSAPSLHSIEKLQAAVDALEDTKCQQAARLATALETLEQDRRECLSGKFRSLYVRCDVIEDLKRMREHSERQRGQRVLAVVSRTADWYPELLHCLLAREGANAVTPNVNTGGLLSLHAAELFIVQAVRRFTNEGCEFQSAQLYEVLLRLHHDDLELLQVQQLIKFLRNALHIKHEEWTRFFAAHGLPEPTDDFADDRKGLQGIADGKPCFTALNTAR